MRHHIQLSLTALLAGANVALAVHKPFSIQDDVLATPQFEVLFPDEYILESDARLRLSKAQSQHDTATTIPSQPSKASSIVSQDDRSDLSQQVLQEEPGMGDKSSNPNEDDIMMDSYHEMVLDGQRFLCGIPNVSPSSKDNTSTPTPNPDQEAVELMRATNRGLELLSDLEGKCLYYAAGWWSYSFCYMNEVRQFHARLPGKGVPVYPPAEDPDSTTYVLGRFQGNNADDSQSTAASTEVAALQTKGDSWYLVQYLEQGTKCDLTRRPRKIEVQFHCHPQSPEHIAWIKEVTTCSYVMVVYTPRLCNDVAFQPPRVEKPNSIKCREIILPEHVPIWEAAKAAKKAQAKRERVEGTEEPFVLVGDIEVGAMKLVGKDGKRIEKDQFGFGGTEKIVLVAKSEGGKVKILSKEMLKKHKVSNEKFEQVKKEMDIAADGRDWRLEEVTTSNGEGLRGIIDEADNDDEEEGDEGEAESKPGKGTANKDEKPKQQKKKKNKSKKQQKPAKGETLKKPQRQKTSDETVPEAGSDETYKTGNKEEKEKKEKLVKADKEETNKKDEKDEKDEL
ncbi:OS-9 [Arthroderma uncinatum]|uniref:OS-9 n=1 Tax=Arthroderma uncinatum TaxID=74035 RepID=UPI00144A7155|nr:OS-9 [Arthroderma uncinatum]KAF3482120.1 OS-9 [Arthroderma uncinatum]